jgi:hypothetical protein
MPHLAPLSPAPDVEGLQIDEAVDLIREWFFANFEDPVEGTPRQDGEYFYIWGGPYDARDVITDVYSGAASEEVIEAAVNSVERYGIDWAPDDNRILDEEPFDVSDTMDPRALHARMLQRIEALEEALQTLATHRAGIGHNRPPELFVPFQDADFRTLRSARLVLDLQAIKSALAVLKAQPPKPAAPPADAIEAAHELKTIGERLKAYALKQTDVFVSEAVKSAGAELGKRLVQSPFWLTLAAMLIAVARAASAWIASLPIQH